MSDDFFPSDFSGVPQTPSNYMKIKDGDNTFRVLSGLVAGYQWFTENSDGSKRPNRVKTFDEVPDTIKDTQDSRKKAKYFWAMVVYNREEKMIQILQLTQKSIINPIEGYARSKKWGHPNQYDIVIRKVKKGSDPKDVDYSVIVDPKEEMDKEIVKQYEDMNINLEALFSNDDPFAKATEPLGEVNIDDKLKEEINEALE